MADPFKIDIDASEVVNLAEAWERAPEMAMEETARFVLEGELLLERETKENTPKATGLLSQSIFAREPAVLADQVIGVVGTAMAYAVPVELGTKPHFPPIQPLADWARLKLGIAPEDAERVGFLIARKISIRGTEAAEMFGRAFRDNQAQVEAISLAGLQRIADRLAEGR
jgi:hypothetical protein